MTVGVCTISLSIPGVRSLKEKRGVIKPLVAHVRKEFNVSVAEVDDQDLWQSATLAVAAVAGAGTNLHGLLEQTVSWIERTQPHVFVTNWEIDVW
jgi:uncharacterized protein YlxP (DUF503 family)